MRNSAADALLGRRQTSFPADPVDYFAAHIRPGGWPWSFVGHEYLRDLIADPAPHRVIMKGAQGGFSVTAFGISTHWTAAFGYAGAYCFPDRARMQAYAQGIFDPLINSDDALARATLEGQAYEQGDAATARMKRKSADNLRLKRIGGGTFWLLGLQKRADVKSLPLDFYCLDEVDEVDQELAIWLQDRLLHSRFRRIVELSQPSVPDWGIDERFALSDQKSWQHRCPKCRTWHILEEEFPRCLVHHNNQEWRIVCLNCGARLRETDSDVQAQWVAAYPGREISGYRFSQLYGPATTAAYLAGLWAKCERSTEAKQNFHNSILGLPFAGDKQPLSVEVMNKACQEKMGLGLRMFLSKLPADARPLILGAADIGDTIHAGLFVWWEDTLHLVDLQAFTDHGSFSGTVRTAWDQLHDFFAECDFAVIDGRPEHSQALKLARAMGQRLALAYFKGDDFGISAEDDGTGDLGGGHGNVFVAPGSRIPATKGNVLVVTQDRTTAIDDMVDLVRGGDLPLPDRKLEQVAELCRHCAKLVKKPHQTTGRLEYIRGVPNHYGLMLTYGAMALKAALRLGMGPRLPLGALSSFTLGGSIVSGSNRSRYDY